MNKDSSVGYAHGNQVADIEYRFNMGGLRYVYVFNPVVNADTSYLIHSFRMGCMPGPLIHPVH